MADNLCEEESDSCAALEEHKDSSELIATRRAAPRGAEQSLLNTRRHHYGYRAATGSQTSTGHAYSLAHGEEAKEIARTSSYFGESCCCDSKVMLPSAGVNTGVDLSSRHAFCGWENKRLNSSSSTHIVIAQRSDHSLVGLSKSTSSSNKSKNSFHIPVSKRTWYTTTKSQVRSYIYSEYSKSIQYDFEHYTESSTSLYIDKYRKTITYPKMERKTLSGNDPATAVEMALWSGRCVRSSAVIKPKLFVLGKPPNTYHNRPITCRKSYPNGQSLYSVAESRVKPTKYRLSSLNTTSPQHYNQHCSHCDGSNQFSMQEMVYSDSTETRHYPVSIVEGYSSQQQVERPALLHQQNQESDYNVGAEDDDVQLNMTWIAEPAPESFLVSSVTYTAPSSKARQKPHRSQSFKGAATLNSSFRSAISRGPAPTFMNFSSGQRPLSSRAGGGDRLSYSFHLTTQSVPLIKSGESSTKQPAKTNKLGHLLKRRHKKSKVWRPLADDTTTLVSTHGVY